MGGTTESRIFRTFQTLQSQKKAAFIPFFVAGDPDLATTAKLIRGAADAGADLIEVGVPFSDPIADGPVIQASYYRALDKGFKVAGAFEMAKSLRAGGLATPLVCMVSFTLVYRQSLDAFLAQAKSAGFDGLIIPDLPAGYEGDAADRAAAVGLDLIFLVAPTTPPARRDIIVKRSRGFVYYISVTGITGARTALPEDLAENVKDLKSRTQTPICVGFGISRAEQAAAVGAVADGVIVGSAMVRKVEEGMSLGLRDDALVSHVSALAKELAVGAHGERGY